MKDFFDYTLAQLESMLPIPIQSEIRHKEHVLRKEGNVYRFDTYHFGKWESTQWGGTLDEVILRLAFPLGRSISPQIIDAIPSGLIEEKEESGSDKGQMAMSHYEEN